MKPPIFSARPAGNMPQQYLHRARMFRAVAISMVDYANAEPNWPKYALLTHAIELSLKAFAHHSVDNGAAPGKEPKQHDLVVGRHGRANGPTRLQPAMRRLGHHLRR
jgi:hypothetical protein